MSSKRSQEEPRAERIMVTSALPYANGPLHLGHIAGAYLPADIYCRYQRLAGRDVVYICGSDEHGVAITLRARKEGKTPQEIVDEFHPMIEKSFEQLGMSFDHYGRTSSDIHRETSQDFFRVLANKDAFRLETSKQLYDPEAELFLADRYVRGTCPTCGYEDAYGDQCESCGRSMSPLELKNPRSALSDATPELRETTHWVLPLGDAQPWLESWLSEKKNWKPNVMGQVQSWLTQGLGDRAITRDIPWGVPVPEDVAKKAGVDATGKVLYVWFDAPIGYISATREWAQKVGTPEAWKDYWQSPESKLVHFIGKDNIVFHCVIFPAMLNLHGEFVLPDNVPANEFLNLKGLKFSTSRGVAVWIHEYLENFPPDYLRYATCKILPEAKDTDFSWEGFAAAINNELADTFGNFVNRTVAFCNKYCDSKVPELTNPSELDQATLAQLPEFTKRVADLIESYRFREAADEMMSLARTGNKYFNDSEPWATRKDNMDACGNTIHVSLQLCASLSILCEPFLPFSAQKIRVMLGLSHVRPSVPGAANDGDLGWSDAGRPLLTAGSAVAEAEILVRKIEQERIDAEIQKLQERAAAPKDEAPDFPVVLDFIEFDDFTKVDLRVGRVLAAEKVKKSKKLICCQVDLGFEKRQVLAGVAEHMQPEDLVGTNVVVVANLKPRKMLGKESQGMLLMAEDANGRLVPATAPGAPGSPVK